MLSQCNTAQGIGIATQEINDYNERYKRDVYDDLQAAIGLLKEFDAKLNKLHPQVMPKIKEMMRTY